MGNKANTAFLEAVENNLTQSSIFTICFYFAFSALLPCWDYFEVAGFKIYFQYFDYGVALVFLFLYPIIMSKWFHIAKCLPPYVDQWDVEALGKAFDIMKMRLVKYKRDPNVKGRKLFVDVFEDRYNTEEFGCFTSRVAMWGDDVDRNTGKLKEEVAAESAVEEAESVVEEEEPTEEKITPEAPSEEAPSEEESINEETE